MIGDEKVVQDVPIVTEKEIAELSQIEFVTKRGKAPNVYQVKTDMYQANDTEFMNYLTRVTKTKKEILLDGLPVRGEDGWNNKNRLRTRLFLVNRHRKALLNSLTNQ